MEENLVKVLKCFEEHDLSRLLTFQELHVKLEPVLEDSELRDSLSTLIEKGTLSCLSQAEEEEEVKEVDKIYFMQYPPSVISGPPLTPTSQHKFRKLTPLRQTDPKVKVLEQECSLLRRRRDELAALLRKLRILKQFRTKDSSDHWDQLIDKWRSACQEAAMDLLKRSNEKITLNYLLKCLDVDWKLLNYDEEADCFE